MDPTPRATNPAPASAGDSSYSRAIRRKKPTDADEASWGSVVEDWARVNGWWIYHVPDSRRTAAGMPDYLLLRAGRGGGIARCVAAEIKVPGGRRRRGQQEVLAMLRTVPGIEVFEWTFPEAWVEAREVLR